MLIDQARDLETRVAVVSGASLEEFDCEIASERPKKGNIYLAKVARIEPSLQAVFIDYGEKKHGFLPFHEIHPDYYAIPAEDRKRLNKAHKSSASTSEEEVTESGACEEVVFADSDHEDDGADDEEARKARSRGYKIQEVIKRHQILLVQVMKDSRGNKGLAFTTYISLPGRYSVLMPNTPKGKGVSRKITDVKVRKKLREMMEDLEIPEGMGMIIRTAGLGRTKTEIKRDYDYLLRLWSELRERVLSSMAPSLIYEERDLVLRVLRDMYGPDIEEVLIQGAEAYKKARAFMRMFTPSHVRRIKAYEDPRVPLFQKFSIESQIEDIYKTCVTLPSGGVIVINPTEALVSIDVNSAKATQTRNFESTALRTNLEAAQEVARQLKLRNFSGLIVIDFIDMNHAKHRAQVEKKLKDALRDDRACVQIGKIGVFGLLEMSRQRLRQSILEKSSIACPHCQGSGTLMSMPFLAMRLLGELEKICNESAHSTNGNWNGNGNNGGGEGVSAITVFASFEAVHYVLNYQRRAIVDVEQRHSANIFFEIDPLLHGENFRIEGAGGSSQRSSSDSHSDSHKHSNKGRRDRKPYPSRDGEEGGLSRDRRERGERGERGEKGDRERDRDRDKGHRGDTNKGYKRYAEGERRGNDRIALVGGADPLDAATAVFADDDGGGFAEPVSIEGTHEREEGETKRGPRKRGRRSGRRRPKGPMAAERALGAEPVFSDSVSESAETGSKEKEGRAETEARKPTHEAPAGQGKSRRARRRRAAASKRSAQEMGGLKDGHEQKMEEQPGVVKQASRPPVVEKQAEVIFVDAPVREDGEKATTRVKARAGAKAKASVQEKGKTKPKVGAKAKKGEDSTLSAPTEAGVFVEEGKKKEAVRKAAVRRVPRVRKPKAEEPSEGSSQETPQEIQKKAAPRKKRTV